MTATRPLVTLFRALRARGVPHEIARRSVIARAVEMVEEGEADIDPILLGNIFQATMREDERHALGAHYTSEGAILEHVVRPSLTEPFQARLRAAASLAELLALRLALGRLRVLDPACGCGSFLLVAHRELSRLDAEIVARLPAGATPAGSVGQLYGIDADPLAIELATITLAIAGRDGGADLRCDDALFCDWPDADLVIGNPPFLSKNKMRAELGAAYVDRLRQRHPEVPGRADYCVHWFRRAHDTLAPGGRAGLVGTNTIRQNDSRRGGLDHLIASGGTITEAVSTMVWPGDAVVHVSVVNWIKGEQQGPKRLSWQEGDTRNAPFREVLLDRIPASLSPSFDVTAARPLAANARAGVCHQGQTYGHEGFLLSGAEARAMCAEAPENAEVIFPCMGGEELLTGGPARWVIDFHPRTEIEARRYASPFARVEALVRPSREQAATRERARNAGLAGKRNRHHESFLRRYWQLGYPRGELIERLGGLRRYIACSRVTKWPVFAFVPATVRPSDALAVFTLEDDYSFGVLQSGVHWAWFMARCSTMKGDGRYTSRSVFDSFPWPQSPSAEQVAAVARAAVALQALRGELSVSLREMYMMMEGVADHPLRRAHAALDAAVREAYGMGAESDALAHLFALNEVCAAREGEGLPVVGPGLPAEEGT